MRDGEILKFSYTDNKLIRDMDYKSVLLKHNYTQLTSNYHALDY